MDVTGAFPPALSHPSGQKTFRVTWHNLNAKHNLRGHGNSARCFGCDDGMQATMPAAKPTAPAAPGAKAAIAEGHHAPCRLSCWPATCPAPAQRLYHHM
eukprot:3902963-Prymnesium_polylepis.1